LPLSDEMRAGDLFVRLIPVLYGASSAEVVVERNEDGSVGAHGDAVRANAHLCSLDIDKAFFDPATGWYGAVTDSGFAPVFRGHGDWLEVFANGRPDYEKYPESGDFVSCGARGFFTRMRRLDLGAAGIEPSGNALPMVTGEP